MDRTSPQVKGISPAVPQSAARIPALAAPGYHPPPRPPHHHLSLPGPRIGAVPRSRIHGSMGEQRRPAVVSRSSDLLSLGSFVVLGLPDGMLGTAWPSMRATFGAPVGDLGLILLIATAGSVLVTAFVGPLIRRLGVPALLAVAGLCRGAGLHRVRPGPRALAGPGRGRAAGRGGRHDGRRAEHGGGPDRPVTAAEPVARRLRRRHRDRPAGRHRRHPHRLLAAGLPGPAHPRRAPGRPVAAAPATRPRSIRGNRGGSRTSRASRTRPQRGPAAVMAGWWSRAWASSSSTPAWKSAPDSGRRVTAAATSTCRPARPAWPSSVTGAR